MVQFFGSGLWKSYQQVGSSILIHKLSLLMFFGSGNITFFCIIVDLVQSASIFRKAAGVYQYLAHDVIPSLRPALTAERPPESTIPVSTVMSLICLAEAQVNVYHNSQFVVNIVGIYLKSCSL